MSAAAHKAAAAALERVRASARPEAWITVVDDEVVLAAADAVADDGALAGVTLAVKDNIDVAGVPTTVAHPGIDRAPSRSATVVERLVGAGCVVIGKTNLDQFATGLVGTRSPFGAGRNVHDPARIAGGSSSGSALAVALGEVDVALGTDTAGSGRVPAALNGVVGLKPTRGLVSAAGVVPACRPFDCVSIFARTVGEATAVLAVAGGHDPLDPWTRRVEGSPVVGTRLRIGVPRPELLVDLDGPAHDAWAEALVRLTSVGELVEVDVQPYLDAGELLYGGALVAERWAAFGDLLESSGAGADPVVDGIVRAASGIPAADYLRDRNRLQELATAFRATFTEVDTIAMPTVGLAPTLAEVAADPVGVNVALGRFTNGCNLLDLCALAVPAGTRSDGIPFGITFLGPAFADPVVAAAGARLLGEPDPAPPPWAAWCTLVVLGAHMRGEPLEGELRAAGGRFLRDVVTAPRYRLHALPTSPPKPGMVRTDDGGAAIVGELWALPLHGFGGFVASIPAPLGIGKVVLADGDEHPGFLCEAAAAHGAPDISHLGGWRAHLARQRSHAGNEGETGGP